MADVMATLGLDRKEFTEGLRTALREGQTFSRRMEGSFQSINRGLGFGKMLLAGGAIAIAMRKASAAVAEFAKYSDRGRQVMDDFAVASSRLEASVGEVLTPAFEALVGVIDDWTDGLISASKAEADSQRSMQKTVDSIKAVRKAREDGAAFVKKLQTTDEANYIESVRISGDERRADILAAGAGFRRQAEEIQADDTLTPDQKRERLGHIDFFRRGAEDLAARKYDTDRARDNSETVRQLMQGAEARAVELLRISGREDEARSAAIAMDSRAAIETVRGSGLDESSKSAWIDAIRRDTDQMLLGEAGAAVRSAEEELARANGGRGGSGNARGLSSGIAGAGAMAAVFGTGAFMAPSASDPMLKAQERLEKATREQTRVLEAIRTNTERAPVAVAG